MDAVDHWGPRFGTFFPSSNSAPFLNLVSAFAFIGVASAGFFLDLGPAREWFKKAAVTAKQPQKTTEWAARGPA